MVYFRQRVVRIGRGVIQVARTGRLVVIGRDNEFVLVARTALRQDLVVREPRADRGVPGCAQFVEKMMSGLVGLIADRKSGVSGKGGAVRVDPGGRRIIKKKRHNNTCTTQTTKT